jgi:ribosome maturation factor RimP
MQTSSLVEAFEQTVFGLQNDDEFRDVEIVAHEAQRHGRSFALSLILDQPGGVTIDLCERVARRLNRALEAREETYSLEVVSAGLERALRTPADYDRFRDRNVRVLTNDVIDGRKTHRGKLAGVRGMSVLLEGVESREGVVALPIDSIKSANLEYDPRHDLRRSKQEKRKR